MVAQLPEVNLAGPVSDIPSQLAVRDSTAISEISNRGTASIRVIASHENGSCNKKIVTTTKTHT